MLLRPRSRLLRLSALVLAASAPAWVAGGVSAQAVSAPATSASPVGAAAPSVPTDPYTVSGVKVDVSADNANNARERAFAEAQAKAWVEFRRRVAPGEPEVKASADEIARVVLGITVDDERITPTRYIASLTVRFRPNAVRDNLAATGAQYVEPPSKALVVLPVTVGAGKPVLWDDRTAWRDAWDTRTGNGLVPLRVPAGELADVAAISALEAAAADPTAIDRVIKKYNAPGAIIVRAAVPPAGQPLPSALVVDVTRVDADGRRTDQSISVPKDPDDRLDDLLRRAVVRASAAIDESFRRDNTAVAGPERTVSLEIPVRDLGDWLEARKRLTGVAGVTRADLLSIGKTVVKVALVYRGELDGLKAQLAKRDLALEEGPGGWRLMPAQRSAGAVPQPLSVAPAPVGTRP